MSIIRVMFPAQAATLAEPQVAFNMLPGEFYDCEQLVEFFPEGEDSQLFVVGNSILGRIIVPAAAFGITRLVGCAP